MKKAGALVIFLCSIFACDNNLIKFDNTPHGNFEALWTILDEHYCFFDYKNIDWNHIKTNYQALVTNTMNNDELFDLLAEMLSELHDGHVNLIAAHDVSRYWNWHEDYPTNFNKDIQKKYLGKDYAIAGGFKYTMLEDSVGYIYYGSFSSNFSDANLSEIVKRMEICKGIVFDVRDNGGGNLTNADRICARFFNEKTCIGYISHKIGKKHTDFSELFPQYVKPYDGIRYQKPIVLLANRSCYSAANYFVNIMKYAPNCTVIGDQTGGGSGLPFSSELPNGWAVRFSASPMFNAEKEHIEFGVQPDIRLDLKSEDIRNKKDTYIEMARKLLNNQ